MIYIYLATSCIAFVELFIWLDIQARSRFIVVAVS